MFKGQHLASWVLLGGVALLALASGWREEFPKSSDEESLIKARQHLAVNWAPGEGLLVVPSWDDGIYTFLSHGMQAEGALEGGLIRGERPDPVDILAHKRVWVLSRFDRAPLLASISTKDITTQESEPFGSGVSLRRYDLAPVAFTRSLSTDIAKLKVTRTLKSGDDKRCRWQGGAHRCKLDPWLDVETQQRNVYHRDVDWVYAHAGPDGGTLTLTWEDIPRDGYLVVRSGFTQASVRNSGGSVTRVAAFIDGQLAAQAELLPHSYDQRTLVIQPPAGDSTMRVRFQITAEKSGWRQVMLQANLLSRLPATLASSFPHDGHTP